MRSLEHARHTRDSAQYLWHALIAATDGDYMRADRVVSESIQQILLLREPILKRFDPISYGFQTADPVEAHFDFELLAADQEFIILFAHVQMNSRQAVAFNEGHLQKIAALRETRQTEFTRRAAGILTLGQIEQVAPSIEIPEMAEDEAFAALARMMERPAFIEWLPVVACRGDALDLYSSWLESAESLRSRIRMTPGFDGAELEAERR